jgi:hypothetical protein
VHVQDLLATPDVGQRDHDLPVEAARAQQRRVEHVGTVGGGDHDDALAGLEAVHLDQQLVQRLLALVVAAAEARAALAADRVDLVDEQDAGRMLLGLLEHVANPGSAHADEHLDEVGARDGEKRHLGLAGDRTGEQRLAGAGRADHQHAARDPAAELLELGRVTQELDELVHFLLGLVAARDVGEGDGVGRLVEHPGLALAERERTASPAALHLAHEEHPHADQQQHRSPADKQGHEERAFFTRLDIELDVVGNQVTDQTTVQVGGGGTDAAVIGGDSNDFSAALTFRDGG